MAVTPANSISLAMDNMRTLLAACTSWQSWTEKDAAHAASRVYLYGQPPPKNRVEYTTEELEAKRPCATIGMVPQDGFESRRIGQGTFQQAGRFVITFEDDVAEENAFDTASLLLSFSNKLGAVLDELLTLEETASYLSVHSVRVAGPHRIAEDNVATMGDFVFAHVEVEWGV